MIDSRLAGTGNSRFLKSIATFKSRYPNYDAFVAALVAGTLPIDLNGVNPEGWAQQGTPLNKATLLSDATAMKLGLSGDPTVNDALDALFTYADNGKNLCAEAVTGMGVSTSSDDTFETIASNVKKITAGVTATTNTVLKGSKFVDKNGKTITGSIPVRGATTIVPTNKVQYIEAGQYLSGRQTIAAATGIVCDYGRVECSSTQDFVLEVPLDYNNAIGSVRAFTVVAEDVNFSSYANKDCVVALSASYCSGWWTVLKVTYDESKDELVLDSHSTVDTEGLSDYVYVTGTYFINDSSYVDINVRNSTIGADKFCPGVTYAVTIVGQ